jgi:hypothetical protein
VNEQDRSQFPPLEARQRFGRTLTAWAARNGWIHSTLQDWGHEAQFPTTRDSTFNRLQNGKIEQPQPLTFCQLQQVNQRVADQNFKGVSSRALMDRLKGSEPIVTKGKLWGAMEFFGHFVGELEGPDWSIPPQLLTVAEAEALSRQHQERFVAIAQERMVAPPVAWKELEHHCAGMSGAERDRLRNVLSGWHQWTPEEWQELASDKEDPVLAALSKWAASG